jgi:hypothetical protein
MSLVKITKKDDAPKVSYETVAFTFGKARLQATGKVADPLSDNPSLALEDIDVFAMWGSFGSTSGDNITQLVSKEVLKKAQGLLLKEVA